MFAKHNSMIEPDNKNSKIWRYMDFTQFMSLLDRKAIFFPTISLLQKNEDAFEGQYTNVTRDQLSNVELHNFDFGIKEEGTQTVDGNISRYSKFTVVNCWNLNDYESVAMWNRYASSNSGIAIQSTFQKLCDCFLPMAENINNSSTHISLEVHVGKIQYLDHHLDTVSYNGLLPAFMWKRKNYEYEAEIRAISMLTTHFSLLRNKPDVVKNSQIIVDLNKHRGLYFPVKLETLIDRIYVSPKALNWYFELVKSVQGKYGLNVEVTKSALDEDPLK